MEYQHIIEKQVVNLKMPVSGYDSELPLKMGQLCKNTLAPILDQVCTHYAIDDQMIQIDKIKLDIGAIQWDHLEDELPAKIKAAFEEKLAKMIPGPETFETQNKTQAFPSKSTKVELLRHFLLTGMMPRWVSTPPIIEDLIGELEKEQPTMLWEAVKASAKNINVRKRLIYLFTDHQLLALTQWEQPRKAPILNLLLQWIADAPKTEVSYRQLRETLWKESLVDLTSDHPLETSKSVDRLIEVLAGQIRISTSDLGKQLIRISRSLKLSDEISTSIKKLVAFDEELTYQKASKSKTKESKETPTNRKDSIKQELPDPEDKGKSEKSVESKQKQNKKESRSSFDIEGSGDQVFDLQSEDQARQVESGWAPEAVSDLIIQNAGLILLWPFLEGYFDSLGFTRNNKFVGEKVIYRSIHVLQYLATNQEHCQEYELGLNKLLCGFPLEEPIPVDIALTDREKESTNELIRSLIKNWSAVKDTSVDSIRETYFQREGHLTAKDNGWFMEVEWQTWDILLNRLPWGIGIIQLPWMEQMIHVDWKTS